MTTLLTLLFQLGTPAIAPAAVVPAEVIESTFKTSIANNTLDTKVNETRVKGGIVRVGILHRIKPEPRALLHDDLTEVYYIVSGSGTLVTGGAAERPTPVSDPPNLGPTPSYYVTQNGGETRKVKPNDVIVVPAGLPHRFSELDGPIDYIIYRFEVTAK